MTADGRVLPAPAATVAVTGGGEGGLLDVAIDPQLSAGQPFVYLSLDAAGRYHVQRRRLSGNTLAYDGTPLGGVPADASVVEGGKRPREGRPPPLTPLPRGAAGWDGRGGAGGDPPWA